MIQDRNIDEEVYVDEGGNGKDRPKKPCSVES